jgi:putative spermidine/putrescine transport system permease protein
VNLKSNRWGKLLLLAPLVICNLVLIIGMSYGVVQSFGYYPEQSLTTFTFDYYIKALTNSQMISSIKLSLYVTVMTIAISVVIATVLTYFLVSTGHDHGPIFVILKIPMLIPWTVTAFLMIDLFGGAGIFASIASFFGWESIVDLIKDILYTPASIGIIIAYCWSTVPFIMYFISPVMSNISGTLGQAASAMGASSVRIFFSIVLPLCKPSIRNATILSAIGVFGGYEIPLLLGMTLPRLLPVEIYSDYGLFPLNRRPEIMALCVIMIILSVVITMVICLLFNGSSIIKRDGRRSHV